MGRTERTRYIEEIQKRRGSKVLVYVSGDRQGLESQISPEIFPVFHKHLASIGDQDRIDLFLYSTGGITVVGYGLVNLIREFAKQFNVIVPFKAYSCATLIALGADEILMTKTGQLSPIDPSTNHALAPRAKRPGQNEEWPVPVSVEEVNGFIQLANTEIGLKKENSKRVTLELLSQAVNPLVLGAVHRAREETSDYARRLLQFHIKDQQKVDDIVNKLTRQMFSHMQFISRKEAKESLRLNIVDPDPEMTDLIHGLLHEYYDVLQINVPYHPETVLAGANNIIANLYSSLIESVGSTDVHTIVRDITRVTIQQQQQAGIVVPTVGYQERLVREGWEENNAI